MAQDTKTGRTSFGAIWTVLRILASLGTALGKRGPGGRPPRPGGGAGRDQPDQPHRRIRRKVNSLYGSAFLMPFLVIGWFWLRLFVCWGNRLGWYGLVLCQSALVPAALVLVLGAMIATLLARDIHATGRSVGPHLSPRKRFVEGYRQLDRSHQRHVIWSSGVFLVVAVLFLLLLWLIPLRLF